MDCFNAGVESRLIRGYGGENRVTCSTLIGEPKIEYLEYTIWKRHFVMVN